MSVSSTAPEQRIVRPARQTIMQVPNRPGNPDSSNPRSPLSSLPLPSSTPQPGSLGNVTATVTPPRAQAQAQVPAPSTDPATPTVVLTALLAPALLLFVALLLHHAIVRLGGRGKARLPCLPTTLLLALASVATLLLLLCESALPLPCALPLWSFSLLLPLWTLAVLLHLAQRLFVARWVVAEAHPSAHPDPRADWVWAEREARKLGFAVDIRPPSPSPREDAPQPSGSSGPSRVELYVRSVSDHDHDFLDPDLPAPPPPPTPPTPSLLPLAPPPSAGMAMASLGSRIDRGLGRTIEPAHFSRAAGSRVQRASLMTGFEDMCAKAFRPSSMHLPLGRSLHPPHSASSTPTTLPPPSPDAEKGPPPFILPAWELQHGLFLQTHALPLFLLLAALLHALVTLAVYLDSTSYAAPASTVSCRGGWEFAPLVAALALHLLLGLPLLLRLAWPLRRDLPAALPTLLAWSAVPLLLFLAALALVLALPSPAAVLVASAYTLTLLLALLLPAYHASRGEEGL